MQHATAQRRAPKATEIRTAIRLVVADLHHSISDLSTPVSGGYHITACSRPWAQPNFPPLVWGDEHGTAERNLSFDEVASGECRRLMINDTQTRAATGGRRKKLKGKPTGCRSRANARNIKFIVQLLLAGIRSQRGRPVPSPLRM